MNDFFTESFIYLAKFAGSRFDLTQAGGGNISWKKPEGELLIKQSGIAMSDINSIDQCARIDMQGLLAILNDKAILAESVKTIREKMARKRLNEANLTPDIKPSIETFFHALLHEFTLHTHPIAVNHLVIRKDAKKIITALFPDSVFVDYATPGIDLALAIKQSISSCNPPKLIFLKNHGLIVSSDNPLEVKKLTDEVVMQIEKTLNISYENYRLATCIADLYQEVTGTFYIAYLSEDREIHRLLQQRPELLTVRPTSPDVFVLNGFAPLKLIHLSADELQQYLIQHGMFPKVILYQENVFFIHQSVRKAKEMADIFKFHLLVLFHAQGEIDTLTNDELLYLANWDAEKFRETV